MSRGRMFLRMLLRPLIVRRGSSAIAVLAIVVAATAATAMLTLFTDVQSKLRGDFRGYGANLLLTAKPGTMLPPDALQRVEKELRGNEAAAPFGYAIAKANGPAIVVGGMDIERTRKLDPFWLVNTWPQPGEALLGARAAKLLGPGELDLEFGGRRIHAHPSGTLRTGSAEDSRIYIPLADFSAWTGLQPDTIEVAADRKPNELTALTGRLAAAIPQAEVRLIKQISDAEANVFSKTRSTLLIAVIIIVTTAALCVLATLTSSVLDRRRDFAVMKALGASPRLASALFACEATLLGATGSVLGFFLGVGVAFLIGRLNFQAIIVPHWNVFPLILLGSIALTILAALVPMAMLSRTQPAVILKGE
jgi:putative ABC transport system permease protein